MRSTIPEAHILFYFFILRKLNQSQLASNNDYTFIGDGGGAFIRVVICVVLYYTQIFPLGKTLKRRGMFVFSWFAVFPLSQTFVECAVCVLFFNLLLLSFSCANLDLAFTRIANLQLFNFDSSFNEFNLQPLQVSQIGENLLWELRYSIPVQVSINKLIEKISRK